MISRKRSDVGRAGDTITSNQGAWVGMSEGLTPPVEAGIKLAMQESECGAQRRGTTRYDGASSAIEEQREQQEESHRVHYDGDQRDCASRIVRVGAALNAHIGTKPAARRRAIGIKRVT